MQRNNAVINFVLSVAVGAPGNQKVIANSVQKFILAPHWMQHAKLRNSGQQGMKISGLKLCKPYVSCKPYSLALLTVSDSRDLFCCGDSFLKKCADYIHVKRT